MEDKLKDYIHENNKSPIEKIRLIGVKREDPERVSHATRFTGCATATLGKALKMSI